MAAIHIHRSHNLSLKKARLAAEEVATQLEQRFGLQSEWEGSHLHFQRPGVQGVMQVGKDELRLEVSLGFLLSALRPTIEAEINRYLDELFKDA